MPDNSNMEQEVSKLFNSSGRSEIEILEDLDKKFEWLLRNGTDVSASNANNRYGRRSSTYYQDMRRGRGYGSASRDFSDELKRTLRDELFGGSAFKKSLNEIRDQLAKDLGVSLQDLPKGLGQAVGRELSTKIKNSNLFKSFDQYTADIGKRMKEAYKKGSDAERGAFSFGHGTFEKQKYQWKSNAPDISEVMDLNKMSEGVSKALGEGGMESLTTELSGMASMAGNTEVALGGLKSIATKLGPEAIALAIAVEVVTDMIGKRLKRTIEDFNAMIKASGQAIDRAYASQTKSVQSATDRLTADVRTMVETPFKILEDAAQRWYETWDSTLRSIAATQGYNQDQVAYLYGAYVDRLKEDGLASVIGANEIVNNLSNVLSKGLQGAAAEEFAYVATKLNAAIPTQDFFNYAETYASVAMQAINQGKTQEEALSIANRELEEFANSLLVASHEITGGFTVGLQNASDIFAKAEQIAQAGRGANGIALGSTFAAISAITGAVAPDLASSLVDAIYKAAVGGNASELVALRSLAGINASNTQFLQALMSNPQEIFGAIFDKLATYQNMANGAYMEVAEGLSGIFGVTMDTLARVDFSQVANAVRASSDTDYVLADSMKLLSSGQSTTNAELMRIAQVNEYLSDEGLSYVLNNEAGRAVMQHMWQEQMTRELQETTYAVELKGSANKFLETLSNTVNFIYKVLTPWNLIGSAVGKLAVTAAQDDYLKADIAEILQRGQVGGGNSQAFYNLTGYNPDTDSYEFNKKLYLTPDLVSLFGGTSQFKASMDYIHAYNDIFGLGGFVTDDSVYGRYNNWINDYSKSDYERQRKSPIKRSAYSWNIVGKSALASAYTDYAIQDYGAGQVAAASAAAASTAQSQSRLEENLQKMLDSMETYYTEDKTRAYEDFIGTAKQFGIADYEEALKQSGLTNEAVKAQYEAFANKESVQAKAEREKKEENFWGDSLLQFTKNNEWLESINSTATNIYNIFDKYLSEWEDYFIKHTVYNNAYTRDSVQKVLDAEKESSETAIYALADALTQNDVSLLVDPTMQTNALLSQILKVANAILNQNNSGIGGVSLPDTLAGLSLGIINT